MVGFSSFPRTKRDVKETLLVMSANTYDFENYGEQFPRTFLSAASHRYTSLGCNFESHTSSERGKLCLVFNLMKVRSGILCSFSFGPLRLSSIRNLASGVFSLSAAKSFQLPWPCRVSLLSSQRLEGPSSFNLAECHSLEPKKRPLCLPQQKLRRSSPGFRSDVLIPMSELSSRSENQKARQNPYSAVLQDLDLVNIAFRKVGMVLDKLTIEHTRDKADQTLVVNFRAGLFFRRRI
jgi:hypothetical protein